MFHFKRFALRRLAERSVQTRDYSRQGTAAAEGNRATFMYGAGSHSSQT